MRSLTHSQAHSMPILSDASGACHRSYVLYSCELGTGAGTDCVPLSAMPVLVTNTPYPPLRP